MKLKHSAPLALVLWLCVATWVGAMIVAKPTVAGRYDDEDASVTLAQLQRNVAHNAQMLAALDALRDAPAESLADALIEPEPAPVPGQDPNSGEAAIGIAGPRLTMIISTDRSRRALVDGQLVRAGQRLQDGSVVRGIGRDRVMLEDASGARTIVLMPVPFSTADASAGSRAGAPQ